jgi:uncharacterized protein YdiU (UPF0061 family)
MPCDGTEYEPIPDEVRARRVALIAKWRAMGCAEGKINTLIERRMRSRRQWW